MNHFTFSNIHGMPWLTVAIVADDIATAIKKFNLMWGQTVKYNVTAGVPTNAVQVLC